MVILVAINGLMDAVCVSWLAGWWSKRRLTAWLEGPESDKYLAKVGAHIEARIGTQGTRGGDQGAGAGEGQGEGGGTGVYRAISGVRTELTARTQELRIGLSGELDTFRKELEEKVRALQAQTTVLGGRIPSDLGSTVRTQLALELKDLESRTQLKEAQAAARYAEETRKEISEAKRAVLDGGADRTAGGESLLRTLDAMDLAAAPKSIQKQMAKLKFYAGMLEGLSGRTVPRAPAAPPNGGAAASLPTTPPPGTPPEPVQEPVVPAGAQ